MQSASAPAEEACGGPAPSEAAAILARDLISLPQPAPVPDMLYVEVDGTDVPVRPSGTGDREGKADDGKARTREVKLPWLFTQAGVRPGRQAGDGPALLQLRRHLRRKGHPHRPGPGRVPAPRRDHFRQVVAIGDGAAWIWTMAEQL
jgi:hypothetical protein